MPSVVASANLAAVHVAHAAAGHLGCVPEPRRGLPGPTGNGKGGPHDLRAGLSWSGNRREVQRPRPFPAAPWTSAVGEGHWARLAGGYGEPCTPSAGHFVLGDGAPARSRRTLTERVPSWSGGTIRDHQNQRYRSEPWASIYDPPWESARRGRPRGRHGSQAFGAKAQGVPTSRISQFPERIQLLPRSVNSLDRRSSGCRKHALFRSTTTHPWKSRFAHVFSKDLRAGSRATKN